MKPASEPTEGPEARPTVWPLVVAAGATLLALGVLTSLAYAVFGLALLALGLGGWIKELLDE